MKHSNRIAIIPLLFAVSLAGATLRPARVVAQTPTAPWQIGGDKQLFIDHRFIDSSENIELTVNPPVKRPGTVLKSDKPWDAFRIIWFSIDEDDGRYQMWYGAFDNDQWAGGNSRLCYAESKDGLNWVKPELGIVEYDGSKANNILLEGVTHFAVFRDPQGKGDQKYKLNYIEGKGVRVGTSGDGIHWKVLPQIVSSPGVDTQINTFWDPKINKYVIFLRAFVNGGKPSMPFTGPIASTPPVVAPKLLRDVRAVGRVEVDDFLQPWRIEYNGRMVVAADELDPSASDIYTHSPYRYPYAADAYFLFCMTYQHFQSKESEAGNDGVNDGIMLASRDSVHWMRYDRRPYLERGLTGEPDGGMVTPTGHHIRVGNYLYEYYVSWPFTHGGFRRLSEKERADKANWGRTSYLVAIQRLDGFVSADAPYTGGSLTTPPLVFSGNELELNVNVAAQGLARVEIQDESGQPIPGYSLDECDRILANDVACTVKWNGKSDVSALAGKPVRLIFDLRSAKLYAFQFVAHDR